MGALHIFLFTLMSITISIHAHNITEMLNKFPEYSTFNSYLTQTKLADEINSRTTITVLALPNGAMSDIIKHPLSVIKNVLSLHILLDFFDATKLHKISDGTTLSTTLYQTTGNAKGNLGSVNITDLKGGKVGFGSAASKSPLGSTYTKSVKQIDYNISVLEISSPIIAPGILTAPAPSAGDFNITGALEKAGCKTFASLLVSSGVIKTYESAIAKGLTVFAPNDEAFKSAKDLDLTKLSSADVVSLLQFHAVPSYTPIGTLKTKKDPISTLATNGASKYSMSASTAGDQVTLDTGVDSSRIASTVIDSTPFAIFTVDSVLLPEELFGKSPSPAPGPAPETSPSPSPDVASPGPAPEASSPSPMLSPPAPPTSSPAGAPADGPAADSENSTAKKKNAGNVNAPAIFKGLLTVSVSVIVSVYLS